MCSFSRPSAPPPAPVVIEKPVPPQVTKTQDTSMAPKKATSTSSIEVSDKSSYRKKRGRGSLRIPLTSSGLSGSGLNFPTS
jgi:hypothetical protein